MVKSMSNTNCKGPHTINAANGSFCNLCALAVGLALHIFAHTVLTSSSKDETAVHCCDPALSVLVMLMSRNVFHVVSALQSIVSKVWFTSLLLFVIERLNDQNPHPGDTHHSEISVGCPPPPPPSGLTLIGAEL